MTRARVTYAGVRQRPVRINHGHARLETAYQERQFRTGQQDCISATGDNMLNPMTDSPDGLRPSARLRMRDRA